MDDTLALADGGVDASGGGFDWGVFASNSVDLIKQAASAAVTVRNAVQQAQATVSKKPAPIPQQVSKPKSAGFWGSIGMSGSDVGGQIQVIEGVALLLVAYLVLK
jgi:hypothetical protein